jgi:uncharacterized protein (DUF433 family)
MQPTVTLEPDLQARIEALAVATHSTPAQVVRELIVEALKTRECPGIVLADGPAGRRAVIAGSGIDVWAVAEVWRDGRPGFECLRRSFDLLTEPQLRAALGYYERCPAEIDEWIARNAAVAQELERTRPPWFKPL